MAASDGLAILNIVPAEGSGGGPLTITGSGFGFQAGQVTVGGAAAAIASWTDTQVVVTTPAGEPGPAQVVLTVNGQTAPGPTFTYSPPLILRIVPAEGSSGGPLTITGSGFGPQAGQVTVGGTAAAIIFWTDTQVVVTTPAGEPGPAQVVLTVNGQTAPGPTFTYSPPLILRIVPAEGSSGGPLTITGSGFGPQAGQVTVGGTAAAIIFWTDTQVVVTTPAGEPGPAQVVLTVNGQTAPGPTFTYSPPAAAPVVSSVSPASGTIGNEVTITGSGFAGATGVSFGTAAGEFSVVSSSEITATVPAGASAGPVTVTGPGGTASSPEPFTVTPGIALSAVSGPPGTTVTVAGAGFGAYEAVDMYFGTARQALAVATGTGNFAGIAVPVPASAPDPGTAYLTAVGRHSGLGAQAQFSVLNTVTVTNPGTMHSPAEEAVGLRIPATDSASGQTLTYAATGLPAGLSINPSTGLISGTPTTAGTSTVTVTAQDTTGASGSATFSWIIYVISVTVTNPGPQTSAGNTAVSLQIQASASPSSLTIEYAAAGLPPGLSIGAGTGLISGTPSAEGEFAVTVTASAGGVSGSATFTWTIQDASVSVLSPGNLTSYLGGTPTLQIQASASPSSLTIEYAAAGLPPGLSIGAGTGLISGTLTAEGEFAVTVTASAAGGVSGYTTFTWTIKPNTVTVTNPGNQTSVIGAASLQILAGSLAGVPLTYAATGLPPGLSIDATTGLISGTAITAGDYTVTVAAQDTTGASGSATFTWTIQPALAPDYRM